MKTLERRGDALAVVAESPPRPAWLAGVPMLVIALIPYCAEGPLTLPRAAMGGALVLIALAFFVSSRPRRKRDVLLASASRLRIGGVEVVPARLVLAGEAENRLEAAPVFRLDVVSREGERLTILENHDPAQVLEQAREIAGALGIPLEPGWGLASLEVSREGAVLPELGLRGEVGPAQRAAAFTASGCTLFVFCFVSMLVDSRLERGLPFLTLSFVLPIAAIAWGILASGWLLGLSASLECSPQQGLRYTRRWFGRIIATDELPADAVRAIWGVSPEGACPTHLLVETVGGPRAWPLFSPASLASAGALSHSPAPISRPAARVEAIENVEVSRIAEHAQHAER